MNWKRTDRLVAGAVFLYAFILYILTVAPATSFWDSGEFIAIANRLQVSHPPGAPFFMLVGRLFSKFVPTEFIALSVNLVSVLSSALTVMLLHLIVVRLVREWQGHPSTWSKVDRIGALAGGVIAACTFAVTDSFWFNAVEAEVYAMSMLFTALVVWLVLKWREEAALEEERLSGGQHRFGLATNRYLILIAYLFGLAIGVHLLNLLAVFFIALIVYYFEFERPEWSPKQQFMGLLATGFVSVVIFLVIYPGVVQVLPGLAGASGVPVFFAIAVIGAVTFGVWWSHVKGMQALNLVMLCLTMVLIGYSTYSLIFIRSAADPPIDENDPETVEAIISYLKREQYGNTPILKGSTYDNQLGRIDTRPESETWFPRRYSQDPNHVRIYSQYQSDSEFFWKYQVGHMYVRYFLWNFVGKANDTQDAPAITGFSDREDERYYYQTPSERASRNVYFGLPLLLGLIGMAFHFMRDRRRAFAVGILFFVSGLGIILYLNQTPFQPRERDYSYVASFFAFAIWVGLGATGIIRLLNDAIAGRFNEQAQAVFSWAGAILLFLAVPGWMALENFDDHDRSGRYVAGDYAYNMLMSVEENAVLFTNGDNDTFPLWYAQEVEGIRQDVRVTNLSLLNTPWYVRQLKNQSSRTSEPLPISMPDDAIDDLTIEAWRPRELELPVDRNQLLAGMSEANGFIPMGDSAEIESPMRWMLEGRPFDQEINLLYGADQVALNMIMTNAQQDWKRPIYFAVTVAPDGQLDLQDYFQLEGQAYRIVPIKHDRLYGRVVPGISDERLRQFRFTGLNDPDVYFDENIRRMVDNYRNIFSTTASQMAEAGYIDEGISLLDWFMEQVPFETIPGDETSFIFLAQAYRDLGEAEKANEILKKAEPLIVHRFTKSGNLDTRGIQRLGRFIDIMRTSYMTSRDFESAARLTNAIADALGDSTLRQTPEELQRFYDNRESQAGQP